jgi:hypothetical protein
VFDIKNREAALLCEISNSHGGEYDVQSCVVGFSSGLNYVGRMVGGVRAAGTGGAKKF